MTRLKKLVDSTRFGATSGETDENKRNELVQEEVRKKAEFVRLENIKRANAGQTPMSVWLYQICIPRNFSLLLLKHIICLKKLRKL